jgi:adenylylsulfate kinase
MNTHNRPGFAIWLTGRPAAGKTTLAREIRQLLAEQGIHTVILDSDELRQIVTPRPQYSTEERNGFYEVMALLAAWLVRNGVNVLIAATAHRRLYRDQARVLIQRFAEVYVDCPLAACRQRDSKGLYTQAAANLPGVGVPYEPPLAAEAVVDTGQHRPARAAVLVCRQLGQHSTLFNVAKSSSAKACVRDWMTPNPITVEMATTLPQAHRLMRGLDVRHLPVVEQGVLMGIVSLSDIRHAELSDAVLYHDAQLEYVVVQARTMSELVKPSPIAVGPQTTIGEAARLMLDHHLTAVPVLDEAGRLVGILTESDMFNALVQNRMSHYRGIMGQLIEEG